jgi:hypothetical protein
MTGDRDCANRAEDTTNDAPNPQARLASGMSDHGADCSSEAAEQAGNEKEKNGRSHVSDWNGPNDQAIESGSRVITEHYSRAQSRVLAACAPRDRPHMPPPRTTPAPQIFELSRRESLRSECLVLPKRPRARRSHPRRQQHDLCATVVHGLIQMLSGDARDRERLSPGPSPRVQE